MRAAYPILLGFWRKRGLGSRKKYENTEGQKLSKYDVVAHEELNIKGLAQPPRAIAGLSWKPTLTA